MWLAQSDIPKLFINAEPGGLIAGQVRDSVHSWPAITELSVPGIHFIQQDSADLIGAGDFRLAQVIGLGTGSANY